MGALCLDHNCGLRDAVSCAVLSGKDAGTACTYILPSSAFLMMLHHFPDMPVSVLESPMLGHLYAIAVILKLSINCKAVLKLWTGKACMFKS